jgi:methylmalonyl-CoA/ethylmalonyl-CoA epimerase
MAHATILTDTLKGTTVTGSPQRSLLTRIDHIAIACLDLDGWIDRYRDVFGLALADREFHPEQQVEEAMLTVAAPTDGEACLGGGSYVQLIRPLSEDSPVGRFIARRGEGIHHVGYGVADIDAALRQMRASGVELVDSRPRHGSMGAAIAFLHPSSLGGVLTELVHARPEGGESVRSVRD